MIIVCPNFATINNQTIIVMKTKVLFILLKKQQVHHAYACITSPNPKSERMHERLGFQLVARFPHTGYKFDKWLDVVWMDKELLSPGVPQPIVPLASFIEQLNLSELLNKDNEPIK